MGRPPSNGGPSFRFNQSEVTEMEAILQAHNAAMPLREVLVSLADKFSAAPERSGKITVQMKQVWNWFQNRRYAIRAKATKSSGGKLTVSPLARDDSAASRNFPQAPQPISAPSATVRTLPQAPQHPPAPSVQNAVKNASDNSQMEYEAKSARDGAWYDVATFLSHRSFDTGDPEVLVRFAGFGEEEDEWVNVCKHVRPRSLPCESSECVAVLPADLILCFQEGKEQALYFDAHVLDAQRRRHDVRGCRCRFLVRYDHDRSEEIVALRKICRRPETDYRLQQLHAVNDSANANQHKTGANIHTGSTLRVYPPAEVTQKPLKAEPMSPAPTRTNAPDLIESKVQQLMGPAPPLTNVPESRVQQRVGPAPPCLNAPVVTEINVQKPVGAAPLRANEPMVTKSKVQQPTGSAPPHANMPEAIEIKVQQAVVAAPPPNVPEVNEDKVQQPVVGAPPNAPEVIESRVQQPVVAAPPSTDVPEGSEVKVQQPEGAEIVTNNKMGSSNEPPDNDTVMGDAVASSVTGGPGDNIILG